MTIYSNRPGQTNPSRVFHETFESYSVGTLPVSPSSPWFQDNPHGLPQVVTSAIDGGSCPHTGTKCIEANWDKIANTYLSCFLPSWSMVKEFLVRFWIRYETDCDRESGSKLFRISNGLGGGNPGQNSYYMDGQLENIPNGEAFSYWEFTNAVQGTGGNHDLTFGTLPFADGNWHRADVYCKQGLSGGAHRTFVDGTQQQDSIVVSDDPAYTWYPLYLMSNWSQAVVTPSANNHVLWDDIEIFADVNTGQPTTGNMFDATIQAA